MKICWFKDSKIGHEKQVLAILDNLALTQDLLIEERYISNPVWLELLLYLLKIKPKQDSIPDIIIGAGSTTTIPMLRYKIDNKTKVISVMKPQFFESKFDLIVAPRHDYKMVPNNVFTYIGSLSKVNINPKLDNIGLIINKNDFTLNSLLKKNIDFKTCLFKSDNPLINQSELIKSFDKNLYDEVLNNNKQISFAENDEELMEWILKFKIKNLIIPYESQGKYILNKKNILNKFTNKNVNVFFYLREWDRLAFPFAKKGFFPFKNKIPELLKKQGLVN